VGYLPGAIPASVRHNVPSAAARLCSSGDEMCHRSRAEGCRAHEAGSIRILLRPRSDTSHLTGMGSAGDPRAAASPVPPGQHLLPAQATPLPCVSLPARGIHPLLHLGKGSDTLVPGILKKQQKHVELKGPKISC